MKYLVSLLMISIVGIGISGFALSTMNISHQGSCIASTIEGSECPTNITEFSTHHISAIQSFMTMVPSPIENWVSLLVSLLLIAASIVFFYNNLRYPRLELLHSRLREMKLHLFHSTQKIISWLALFELSPSLL